VTIEDKGRRSRQHIFETAMAQFAERGFAQVTMRDIAQAAGCSLGLAYKYFASKEELVLALYAALAEEFVAETRRLEAGTLAARFHAAMNVKCELLAPHRATLGALVAAALDPSSEIAVLGARSAEVRARVTEGFRAVVDGAADAPPPAHRARLTSALYAAHLLIVLVCMHDRTPKLRSTRGAIDLVRDLLALFGPSLGHERAQAALKRLDGVLAPLIHPPREVEREKEPS
jgi:AcrR family transcriptional regulator